MHALTEFVLAGHTRFAECLALFLIPFIHEDVAILGGSLLIVEHRLPASLAIASLYTGMIASDVFLYGLGVLAGRSRWARRQLVRPEVERLGTWLGQHVMASVAVARVVPGLMFPVYIGCGLYRISFARFAASTVLTAAVYLPVVLFVASRFGGAVFTRLGYWSWFVAIALVAIVVFGWIRNPSWRLFLRVSASGASIIVKGVDRVREAGDRISHHGMPAVGRLATKVAYSERIPPLLFYIPLGVQWLWLGIRHRSLSLPTLANPKIEVGGLWGESKTSYLDMVGGEARRWLAAYTTVTCSGAAGDDIAAALEAARRAGLTYPLVAKPDIGWRGFGVRLIRSEDDLAAYVRAYPAGERLILQRLLPWDGEAGVLYARMPGDASGRVVSLTFRYFPYVVGDGRRPIRDLILADQRAAWKAGYHFGLQAKHLGTAAGELERVPAAGETVRLSFIGSNRVGGLYRDERQHITPELTRRFDEISRSMPEFYYGRYDVRFASVERFRAGEDFGIIEINGAGGESINVWDPAMPIAQVYRELFAQQRLLFEIGAKNRARGFKPAGLFAVFRSQWRQHRLILRYPPSS